MAYSWIATEMRTGRVIGELPDLGCDRVGITLGDFYSASATLPIPSAPTYWQRAIMPYGSCLVLLDGDVPVWGGIVATAPRTASDTISLSLASWESYFARRFVGDVTYTATEQCALVADLATDFLLDGTVPLIVEYTAGATTRDRVYTDAADKTLLAAMQELSGVEGGPEWTVTWRHLSDPERYVPVLTVRDRIGSSPAAGLAPAATFEMPGAVSQFSFVAGDWASGSGANRVVATSTGAGDVRPQSTPQVFADVERPTVEYRWSPSSSIDTLATLNGHASAALARLKWGAQSLSLSAAKAAAPRLGVDWFLGDDIGYRITAPSVDFIEGVARCVGWELTPAGVETITPILAMEGF